HKSIRAGVFVRVLPLLPETQIASAPYTVDGRFLEAHSLRPPYGRVLLVVGVSCVAKSELTDGSQELNTSKFQGGNQCMLLKTRGRKEKALLLRGSILIRDIDCLEENRNM
ncbi:hypothetical protein COCON_G00170030, partial [Conger conger]